MIDGAHGVAIKGLTIQSGSRHGINGTGGAAFTVKNVTVQDSGENGILLHNNTSAELTESAVRRSGVIGLLLINNSTVVLKGNFSSADNGCKRHRALKAAQRWKSAGRRSSPTTTGAMVSIASIPES